MFRLWVVHDGVPFLNHLRPVWSLHPKTFQVLRIPKVDAAMASCAQQTEKIRAEEFGHIGLKQIGFEVPGIRLHLSDWMCHPLISMEQHTAFSLPLQSTWVQKGRQGMQSWSTASLVSWGQ